MKKDFNLSKISIVSVLCAAFVAPAFAASSVRSLGGAGTYVGTNAAAKTTDSSTRTNTTATTARVGTLRVNPSSTRVTANSASLRAPSTRAATTQRLSIGKYLAGSGSLGGSSIKVDASQSGLVSASDFEELKQKLENLTHQEIELSYEDGKLTVGHGENSKEIPLYNEADAQAQLDEYLREHYGIDNSELAVDEIFDDNDADTDKTIVGAINKLNQKIDSAGGNYEAGDGIEIVNNKISFAGAIADALTGSNGNALVTEKAVMDYAIPKPDETICGYTTCVLSYDKDNDELVWLQLVDGNEEESQQPVSLDDVVTEE